jgi:hypothetical protein
MVYTRLLPKIMGIFHTKTSHSLAWRWWLHVSKSLVSRIVLTYIYMYDVVDFGWREDRYPMVRGIEAMTLRWTSPFGDE